MEKRCILDAPCSTFVEFDDARRLSLHKSEQIALVSRITGMVDVTFEFKVHQLVPDYRQYSALD